MKSERTLARIGVIATLILLFATITTLYVGSTGAPKLVGQDPAAPATVPMHVVSLSK